MGTRLRAVPGAFAIVLAVLAVVLPGSSAGARSSRPHLTPAQMAGQRVIYGYAGLTPPASLLQRIRAGEAAGVIFFGDNISSTSQIASVISELNAANAQSPVKAPLLLMTDQEGGQVRRLPGEPTLSEKQVGQSADPVAAATAAGTGAAQNLAGVGMTVNLAPVLDVYRQEGNFIDEYGRSYGQDPAQVSALGRAFVTATQKGGVAATAKHFPGLGAAAAGENTDEEPVTLTTSLSDIRGVDEAPYPAAIAAGVDLVMVSWATYPALDANHPAGLSSTVIGGELRQRLGFRGVTITDSLDAGAVSPYGTPAQRAVLAAGAGADLMIYGARDASEGDAIAGGLSTALQNGQLDQSDFQASVQRVTTLRQHLS